MIDRRKTRPLYRELASIINAFTTCSERWKEIGDSHYMWMEKHEDRIDKLCEEHFPHGSGFDTKSIIVMDKCNKGNQLCIRSGFHPMNDVGMYDEWIDFTVTAKPCLMFEYHLIIKGKFGKKHQPLKDYINEVFGECLDKQVPIM